jgi:hypothetical protein
VIICSISWPKISGCDLAQHRRKQNEILATNQRHLYVRSTREPFVEVYRRIKPGKSATGNEYSSRFHAITANRDATRAIKILFMVAIVQSFSHLFSQAFQRLNFRESWFFWRCFIQELAPFEINQQIRRARDQQIVQRYCARPSGALEKAGVEVKGR